MATADKLKKYITDIANAIRAKEGSTELINPQDFVERINALSIGGGGDAEYGVYLKILDVNCSINEVDTALKVDSPEVLEFFSDAFDWLPTLWGESNYYEEWLAYKYNIIVTYEAQKKAMGLQNVYDSLPYKRIPILALRTKPSYWEDGSLRYPEKIILLDSVYDGRKTSDNEFYCQIAGRSNTLGLEYHDYYSMLCVINQNGLSINEVSD